jgi:probable rRNA maturation factor
MGAEPTTSSVLVEGIDTQVDADADGPVDLDRWTGLAREVLSGLGFDRPVEMGLRFVDPDEIAELNEQHRGIAGPTDVLSFPVDGDPRVLDTDATTSGAAADEPAVLGDVVVCPAVAATAAAERSIPVDDELALLIVHGILHLLGWDHRTPDESAAMQAEERRQLSLHHPSAP